MDGGPVMKTIDLVRKGKNHWKRYLYERSERRRKKNDEKALIDALKAIARRSREGEMTKCPKCEGRGTWREYEYDAADMRDLKCFFRCKYCDGTGKIKIVVGEE